MKRTILFGVCLGMAFAWVIASCSPAPSATPPGAAVPAVAATAPSAQAVTAAPPQKQVILKFATGSGGLPDTYTWIVADAKGFFQGQGLNVQASVSENASKTVANLSSGDIQLASIATSLVAAANLKGTDIPVVGGDESGTIYSLVVPDNIQSWTDLKGKTVAMSSTNTQSNGSLRELMLANGIKPDVDVMFVNLDKLSDRQGAVYNNTTGGAVLAPGELPLSDITGGYHVLTNLPSQSEWPQVIAASPKFLKENPEAVVAFLKAYIQARRWAHDPKNLAELRKIVESRNLADYSSEKFAELMTENVSRRPADLSISLGAVDQVIGGVLKSLNAAGEKNLKLTKALDLIRLDILKKVWADLHITPLIQAE